MDEIEIQPIDNVDLVYILSEHGWSELHFFVDGRIHSIDITHIFGDPFVDLMGFCCGLLRRDIEFRVAFPDEPGGSILKFLRYPAQQHIVRATLIETREFPVATGEEMGSEVVSFDIKASHLATLLYYQIEKTMELCRVKSFAANRRGEETLRAQTLKDLRKLWSGSRSPAPC